MSTRHTPGPWLVRNDEICFISKEDDQSFGMACPIAQFFGERAEANARLIAAAPELLAALTELEFMFAPFASDSTLANGIHKARAAIAKATGEQQ